MNKIFDRFRRRLMIEAIGKASIAGALIGASGELVFMVVMHLISRDPGWLWIGAVFGIPFVLGFGLFFGIAYYPTQKRVAKRIDDSGLQERAGTMLEFRGKSSNIIELQRNDATERIKATETKQVRFRFAPKLIVASAIVMALSIGCMFVPYTIMSVFAADSSTVDADEAQMIKDLLAELRQKVTDADVSEEIKEQLEGVLDELEENLESAEGELDKAAQISKAESEMEQILKEYLTKTAIGSALAQFESTAELGKAIENGDTEGVSTALANMETSILALEGEEQAALLSTIASDITNALTISEVSETNSLYVALNDFATALTSASGTAAELQDATEQVEAAIDAAESAIIAALEEQAKIEDVMKDFEDALQDAKDEVLGNEPETEEGQEGENPEGEMPEGEQPEGEMPEGEKPEGEQPEGEMPEGEMPEGERPEGEMPEGEVPEGEGGGSSSMTEGIYDPSSGSVEYGEVFAAYYAEYLASLKDGEIPEDMQTILDKYFESLNQ